MNHSLTRFLTTFYLLRLHVTQKLCSSLSCYLWVFSFLALFLDRLAKVFLQVSSFAIQKSCDQDRVFSLDILVNVFVSNLFLAKFRVWEHGMSCTLEMNNNGGFIPEHGNLAF